MFLQGVSSTLTIAVPVRALFISKNMLVLGVR